MQNITTKIKNTVNYTLLKEKAFQLQGEDCTVSV